MTSSLPSLLVSAPDKDGGIAIINGETITPLAGRGHTGLCVGDSAIAIVEQDQTIHLLRNGRESPSIRLGKRKDVHDVLLKTDRLYAAVTARNTIIEIDTHSRKITNTWKFEGKGDSWHINCLGYIDGRLHFSAFGKFLKHREYKTLSEGKGFIAELASRKVIINGLSQPHSIVSKGKNVWVCNSLMQEVLKVSGDSRISSGDLGGYTRGLCVVGTSLFVGVSVLRNGEDNGKNAFILELDKNSLTIIRKIDVPFKEIYGIATITSEKEQDLLKAIANKSLGGEKWHRQVLDYWAIKKIDVAIARPRMKECLNITTYLPGSSYDTCKASLPLADSNELRG